jgi:phage shock protein PspC (stress-responsive transcriptional regulator)
MTTASTSTDQPTDRPDARPQLRRSGTEKMLGGVCGGLAEHTGIDPLLWRAGFVALAVTGAGFLLYLLLWVLMPPAERDEKPNALDGVVGDLHARLTGGRPTTRG